jgi:prepilin-type N-terminal cleavage/methylation domain-containing protein
MDRRARHNGPFAKKGMTVLEIMIVMAIIGMGAILVRSGFRMISKADLVENATEMAAILKRTNQLAIEHGEMHRVVFDFEKGAYVVEVCQGATAIMRNEKLIKDPEQVKAALERGKQRLAQMPEDALAAGDAEEATKRATAIAGHHVADRQCAPATDAVTGTVGKAGWARQLYKDKGIKLKRIFVQHREDAVTKDHEAIYFFPMGAAEKAVVELTDGSETFTILVHGLTGRVELRDGELDSVDDHMMRNAMGDKDVARDGAEDR